MEWGLTLLRGFEGEESREQRVKMQREKKQTPGHYGTKPGHFETSKIHFPTSDGESEVSERGNK